MANFGLEMIFMVVGPAEEGGDDGTEMRSKEVNGHGGDGELNISKRRFDDFAIGRREEDENCSEDLGVHPR